MPNFMQMRDRQGRRKYLTEAEWDAFEVHVKALPEERQTFCLTLFYTGCRISEALELVSERVDVAKQTLVFECLKKRRRGIFREVPIPDHLLEQIQRVHDLSDPTEKLWPFCRRTGLRIVRRVMAEVDVNGIQGCPRGLRHSYGVHASLYAVSPGKIQKWMGHADLKTTMIYADAVDAEEREMAARLWDRKGNRSA